MLLKLSGAPDPFPFKGSVGLPLRRRVTNASARELQEDRLHCTSVTKRHLKGAKKAITSLIRTGRLLSSLRCGTQLEARRSLRKRPFKCDTLRSCTCGACLRGIQRSEPLESKQNARNVTPPPSDGDSPAFTNREDPRPQLPGSDAQGLAECPGTSQEDCLTCLHCLHVFKV